MDLLENYKKEQISKLNSDYNLKVNTLTKKLSNDLKIVTSNKIMSTMLKNRTKNALVEVYLKEKNGMYRLLQNNIIYINGLNIVPGYIPVNYALLVGINYVGTKYQLYGCVNDANNIKNWLQDKGEYKNFVTLLDSQATKQNIINGLTEMLAKSQAGDKLFFAYSGHGSYILDKNGDEMSGYDNVIIPIDAINDSKNLIVDDELKAVINKGLKSGVSLFALLDCCFSGTSFDLRYNYLDSENKNNMVTNLKESETRGQVVMISGCSDNQTSADAFIDGKQTGAMTYSFLKALENEKKITYKNLLLGMREYLSKNYYDQIPQLSSGKSLNIETNIIV